MTSLPSFDLAGEVALVTGASSGIGRHIAELLAAAGVKVGLAARRADLLAEVASDIAAEGGESLPIACDVTQSDSVVAAVAKAESELGPLTILINNAGVVVSKPLFEHTEADWDHVVDTNLKGAWLAAREFAHHLVGLKRPGRIINISSVLGFRTIGRVPAYCAAKAGLSHLTRVLAMELARHGILVNTIAPGYVEIKDRSKDIIISGGENISSLEVEEALYRHPEVMEAAVVAKPDPAWGETPCAFVTLKPNGDAVSAVDIIAWCRANLAHYKVPRTVVFGPLPKTSTGKIQKFELRERAKEIA